MAKISLMKSAAEDECDLRPMYSMDMPNAVIDGEKKITDAESGVHTAHTGTEVLKTETHAQIKADIDVTTTDKSRAHMQACEACETCECVFTPQSPQSAVTKYTHTHTHPHIHTRTHSPGFHSFVCRHADDERNIQTMTHTHTHRSMHSQSHTSMNDILRRSDTLSDYKRIYQLTIYLMCATFVACIISLCASMYDSINGENLGAFGRLLCVIIGAVFATRVWAYKPPPTNLNLFLSPLYTHTISRFCVFVWISLLLLFCDAVLVGVELYYVIVCGDTCMHLRGFYMSNTVVAIANTIAWTVVYAIITRITFYLKRFSTGVVCVQLQNQTAPVNPHNQTHAGTQTQIHTHTQAPKRKPSFQMILNKFNSNLDDKHTAKPKDVDTETLPGTPRRSSTNV